VHETDADSSDNGHLQLLSIANSNSQQVNEERLMEFVRSNGLDAQTVKVLKGLSHEDQEEAIATYSTAPGTNNASARFMSWLGFMVRKNNLEAKQCYAEVMSFANKLQLNVEYRRLLGSLRPSLQRKVVDTFIPPELGDVNDFFDAHVTALLSDTEENNCERLSDKDMKDILEFAAHWRLGPTAVNFLKQMPAWRRIAAMAGFTPSGSIKDVNGKFLAYAQMIGINESSGCYGGGTYLEWQPPPVPIGATPTFWTTSRPAEKRSGTAEQPCSKHETGDTEPDLGPQLTQPLSSGLPPEAMKWQ